MADGVVGEHTEVVIGVAEQVTKRKHEHALILLQLMVEINVKEIRLTQRNVKLRNVLV